MHHQSRRPHSGQAFTGATKSRVLSQARDNRGVFARESASLATAHDLIDAANGHNTDVQRICRARLHDKRRTPAKHAAFLLELELQAAWAAADEDGVVDAGGKGRAGAERGKVRGGAEVGGDGLALGLGLLGVRGCRRSACCGGFDVAAGRGERGFGGGRGARGASRGEYGADAMELVGQHA